MTFAFFALLLVSILFIWTVIDMISSIALEQNQTLDKKSCDELKTELLHDNNADSYLLRAKIHYDIQCGGKLGS